MYLQLWTFECKKRIWYNIFKRLRGMTNSPISEVSFGFITYLSTRGDGAGTCATPHCRRQNIPSSQLTTKFAWDDTVVPPSSDVTGTTPLGKKHRTRIWPLSVMGHTRNRVPEITTKCHQVSISGNSIVFYHCGLILTVPCCRKCYWHHILQFLAISF